MEEKFDRGTALTVFKNDRVEDLAALALALFIALLVYVLI